MITVLYLCHLFEGTHYLEREHDMIDSAKVRNLVKEPKYLLMSPFGKSRQSSENILAHRNIFRKIRRLESALKL